MSRYEAFTVLSAEDNLQKFTRVALPPHLRVSWGNNFKFQADVAMELSTYRRATATHPPNSVILHRHVLPLICNIRVKNTPLITLLFSHVV